MQKNEEYIVDIIDNGFEGEGIAKINNFTVFIPGAIKGEKIKILIVKVTSSYAFGKILEILKASEYRCNPVDCATYKRCGGCNLRHIQYKETLNMKKNTVQNLVNKNLKQKIEVEQTIGMENPYNYRDKAQFPVGVDKKGNPVVGVFANRTHEIIPIDKCLIQTDDSQEIAKFICEFAKENNIAIYDETKQTGILRHIIIRTGIRTNEIMCILVIKEDKFASEEKLVKKLIHKFKNIKTIVKNINSKNTNVILGKKNINLYGNGYIYDNLGDLISSYSHGMKQKLAIISALIHDPKLIIMDEPFVGLDPKASHLLKRLMREICDRQGAIFFYTHVLEVAEKLCDKVAIIKGGKLIRSGTMEEVKGDTSLEDVFLELEDA